jgi:hypothetical protein
VHQQLLCLAGFLWLFVSVQLLVARGHTIHDWSLVIPAAVPPIYPLVVVVEAVLQRRVLQGLACGAVMFLWLVGPWWAAAKLPSSSVLLWLARVAVVTYFLFAWGSIAYTAAALTSQ